MANNNFLWTLNDETGNLLAYQEREGDIQIIDADKARQRCVDLVIEAMNDKNLDYVTQLQHIGETIFMWRKVIGSDVVFAKKSSIVLPDGQGGFN